MAEPVKSMPGRTADGHFKNPWPTWNNDDLGLSRFLRFKREKKAPMLSKEELDRELPVVHATFEPSVSDKLRVTWIGHATVLVQFPDGLTVLTDPIWADRCSPVFFAGPRRYRPPPCTIEELPKIDIVVVSHNHYDHLCKSSVVQLLNTQRKRFGGHEPTFYVPLGQKAWFRSLRTGTAPFSDSRVIEMTWWDRREHPATATSAEAIVHCVPAQHWSTRSLSDRYKTLWSGWSIESAGKRFFFAGDTGYCTEFATIGHYLGPFDLAAIPIGCFKPEWFMANQHIGPKEALSIHAEVRSRFTIGIHFGTYDMGSLESCCEPRTVLADLIREAVAGGEQLAPFITLRHGETHVVE